MAVAPDTSESPLAPIPGSEAVENARLWSDIAIDGAVAVLQSLAAASDSAATKAASGLSKIRSTSSDALRDAKDLMEQLKIQYDVYEDAALAKIKEGIVVAAAHPEITCGIAVGAGLVAFKRPRRFLIHNARRMFVSEESLLVNAEAKVNELRQSVDLVKKESQKLKERALKAEDEVERGLTALKIEGKKIQGELRLASNIERKATGLKDCLGELPRREASQYRSQVADLLSQLSKEKKDLNRAASRIINHGIPF